MVLLFIAYQFFALPFNSAVLLPFILVSTLASAASANVGVLAALALILAGGFYFLYTRFDFNDLVLFSVFIVIILFVAR
jgi:hypothetical protein